MRILSLAAALAGGMTVAGTAALAELAPRYTAVALVPPVKALVLTRTTAWRCAGATCSAAAAPERPAVLCQLVVDRVGRLASFAIGGVPIDAAALDRCNARAK